MAVLMRLLSWVAHILGSLLNLLLSPVFRLVYEQKKASLPNITHPLLLESATSIAKKIRKREVKSEEVVQIFIDRIKAVNPVLNAVVADRFSEALQEAREVDKLLDSGDLKDNHSQEKAPFLGVPFTAKEAFGFKGLPNTSGLLCRKNCRSADDAAVVKHLKQAGAIPLALTNCSELCMWWESANLQYGRTNNAYHAGRIVGGSSGGEGCILSAAGSVIGVGSDIGGSIRMPAFFNGIFGHKPSTGIVDNSGQYPNAKGKEKEFLVTGPMCRYACDLLPMFKVMATSEGCAKLKLEEKVNLKNMRYFTMEDDGGSFMLSPVNTQLKQAQNKVVDHFEQTFGVKVTKVNIKKMRLSFPIWTAKMSTSGGEKFCALMAEEGAPPVSGGVELLMWLIGRGRHTLPAIMLGIVEKLGDNPELNDVMVTLCEKLKEEFKALLGEDGVLFYPSHPKPAPYHNHPLLTPFNWAYTGIFNVLGLPVTQCPLGLGEEGVPLGLQVVGGLRNDHLTLAVAEEIERAFGGWVAPSVVSQD